MWEKNETPSNVRSLRDRIRNAATELGVDEVKIRNVVAAAILADILPGGAIKGGTSMALRLGPSMSRRTEDIDVVRSRNSSPAGYFRSLALTLSEGHAGLTGRMIVRKPPRPAGIAREDIMRPVELKLSYKKEPWFTVKFELSRDELGSAQGESIVFPEEVRLILDYVGIPVSGKGCLLALDHQIVEKLHACTRKLASAQATRARDLVDIQLLANTHNVDPVALGERGRKVFQHRSGGGWPPVVNPGPNWAGDYQRAKSSLPVEPDVLSAATVVNEMIKKSAQVLGPYDDPSLGF